jgi:hypothetical protein
MHILLMLFVSTLAALPADFEPRCKNRQAGNFRQAACPDMSLGLGNEASGRRTKNQARSPASRPQQFRKFLFSK